VLVDMQADVWFVFLDSQTLQASSCLRVFTLSNLFDDVEDSSTWSLSIHPTSSTSFKIAVGSNSYRITVFQVVMDGESSLEMQDISKLILTGHEHNVPSLSFSPCGDYLASCSIDGSIRIWNVEDGSTLIQKQMGLDWGWAIRWIQKQHIKKPLDRDVNLKLVETEDDHISHSSSKPDGAFSLAKYMLVYCTNSDIFLVDANSLNVFWHEDDYIDDLVIPGAHPLHRMLFVEVLPELNLIICGSSAGFGVCLSRIFWRADGLCQLSPQMMIPEHLSISPQLPCFGVSAQMSCLSSSSRFGELYILYGNGDCIVIELSNHQDDTSPVLNKFIHL
jgi:hypothetical protein